MKRKSILVVEDDRFLMDIMKDIFCENYNVLCASKCAEARKHVSKPIDLALIDYQLPDGSGIDLLKIFKITNPSMPVTIMTGYSTEEVVIKALRAGAVDYIKKPVDFEVLVRKIATNLYGPVNNKSFEREDAHSGITMEEIEAYIKNSYTEELTLDKLAERAGMDRFKFSRAFKSRFGQCFTSFLNNVRLKNAAEFLSNPHLSITEIAYLCGFGSVEHFDRRFKLLYGLSPREHRKFSCLCRTQGPLASS